MLPPPPPPRMKLFQNHYDSKPVSFITRNRELYIPYQIFTQLRNEMAYYPKRWARPEMNPGPLAP